MTKWLSKLTPIVVIGAVVATMSYAARSPLRERQASEIGTEAEELRPVVERVDAALKTVWTQQHIQPAKPAPDLQVLRRLSLALHGAAPSLEEIRRFESDRGPDVLFHWTRQMLADTRFSDYFAERLARGFVGTEGGQFIIFRRDQFVNWLRASLRKNMPYDAMVRQMITEQGLWTGQPAVNFVAATIDEGNVDREKLTGRTVRAFLGQRIDCAQCHDHPFEDWKQDQFQGLAAFYGQVQLSIVGIEDKVLKDGQPVEYKVLDRGTGEHRVVDECVPFHPEWLPATGTRRERLAAWITHPDNRRFHRAVVNRVWGLLFGRAFREPVDDLPDPPADAEPGVLDLLAADFREHNCDLGRLIQVITGSVAFRAASESAAPVQSLSDLQQAEVQWAMFPLVRLRPEQVIGSIMQCSTAQTADQSSHLIFRLVRFFQGAQFVKEYGDLGDVELQDRGGTIPQRLLLINGELAGKAIEPNGMTACSRVAKYADTPEDAIEVAYLICLTRRPTQAERDYFMAQLQGEGVSRAAAVEDLFWSLLNSTEFSWNH